MDFNEGYMRVLDVISYKMTVTELYKPGQALANEYESLLVKARELIVKNTSVSIQSRTCTIRYRQIRICS